MTTMIVPYIAVPQHEVINEVYAARGEAVQRAIRAVYRANIDTERCARLIGLIFRRLERTSRMDKARGYTRTMMRVARYFERLA